MKISTLLKYISGGIEALLGIPVLGGLVIISMGWTPLLFMLVFHIVTLIFSMKEKERIHGSVLGIVTSCLGWIPFLGMILHIITAILLLLDGRRSHKQDNEITI
ncbi:hypothetical protein ACM26V_14595 [Salipaludibacillus sp. HK11]|uniref:hypothetical protein n=1 Tax=Salipaludibacillus sp. HK11 TaxID=3394320 RepID=UPI0039FCD4E1